MAENSHISFDRDLEALQPITLEEMKSVKLMNRVDAKFLRLGAGYILINPYDGVNRSFKAFYVNQTNLNVGISYTFKF